MNSATVFGVVVGGWSVAAEISLLLFVYCVNHRICSLPMLCLFVGALFLLFRPELK